MPLCLFIMNHSILSKLLVAFLFSLWPLHQPRQIHCLRESHSSNQPPPPPKKKKKKKLSYGTCIHRNLHLPPCMHFLLQEEKLCAEVFVHLASCLWRLINPHHIFPTFKLPIRVVECLYHFQNSARRFHLFNYHLLYKVLSSTLMIYYFLYSLISIVD